MANEYKIGALSKALTQEGVIKAEKDEKLQNLFRIDHKKEGSALQSIYIPQETDEPLNVEEEPLLKRRKKRALLEDLEMEKEDEEASKRKKKRKFEKDPNEDKRTVFVGNLPNTIQSKDILKLFKKYGNVESVRIRSVAVADLKVSRKEAVIKKQFNKNRSNLNAYVKFKTPYEAKQSLKLNEKVVDGYHIRVDLESRRKVHDNEKSVFIGNLPFNMEEDAVYAHFEDCGEIDGVRLIRDSETGIGKGFGYVLFKTKHGVELALRLDGTELKGRNVRVHRAVEDAKKQLKYTDKKVKRKERSKEEQSNKKFLNKYLMKSSKQSKNKKRTKKQRKTNNKK